MKGFSEFINESKVNEAKAPYMPVGPNMWFALADAFNDVYKLDWTNDTEMLDFDYTMDVADDYDGDEDDFDWEDLGYKAVQDMTTKFTKIIGKDPDEMLIIDEDGYAEWFTPTGKDEGDFDLEKFLKDKKDWVACDALFDKRVVYVGKNARKLEKASKGELLYKQLP